MIFCPRKKLGLIQGIKYSAKKSGFSISKVGIQGIKETPPQNKISMGVIVLAFFDPRSSRGPQRLPESAI